MPDLTPTLLPFMVFSDSVIREEGSRKLSLIGMFQQFNLPKFPAQAPLFYVTIRLTNLDGKLSKQKLAVQIEGSGPEDILAKTELEISSSKELTAEQEIEMPLPIPLVVFKQPGRFNVTILWNNRPIACRSVIVNALTAPIEETKLPES